MYSCWFLKNHNSIQIDTGSIGHLGLVTIHYEYVIDMCGEGILKPMERRMKNSWPIMMSLLFMACQSTTKKEWSTQEDCATLPAGDIKDDCYGHFIVDIFKSDSKRGMVIMQQEISNDSVRDYLWLEITRKVDPTTTKFCQLIQSQTLLKRCQTLVSRPHLHRETLRQNESQKNKTVPQRQPQ